MTSLEICCGDLASVLAAKEGGASRIELCSGLAEGGVTPSYALIKSAVATGIAEVNVLIRARAGDFLYTDAEIDMMVTDIKIAVELGATGVVIGALTAEGDIDTKACRRMINAARDTAAIMGRNVNITFHRAFDLCRDWSESLETIIGLGCNCVLTSGLAPNAVAGKDMLRRLVEASSGRITIMAGAGVKPSNAEEIVHESGVSAIHSTAREAMESGMKFRRASVPMGVPGCDEYAPLSTSARVVNLLARILSH
ncbi:MAG: copper homeostasis protein CutC [Clostridiales bacterium]|nr:copper homeostasis protein CutC [Clostridiales bacterium]